MAKDTIPVDLRRELKAGRVVVVVGAGVSVAASQNNPVASWRGLLRSGLTECVDLIGRMKSLYPDIAPDWAEKVSRDIESTDIDDLLSAAEKIDRKLSGVSGAHTRWITETVGALRPINRAVLEAIDSLGVPIATTNYDGLIEIATEREAVTRFQRDSVDAFVRGDASVVLHLMAIGASVVL
ncbi:MAG: hypothetical protein QM760_16685 [Nibricoccus sp.]